MEFIQKIFEIYNARFWWFLFIVNIPCIAGVIGCLIQGIKEKYEAIQR